MRYYFLSSRTRAFLGFLAVSDDPVSGIIRRHRDRHLVTYDDADLELLHFSAQSGNNLHTIFQEDLIVSSAAGCRNGPLNLY